MDIYLEVCHRLYIRRSLWKYGPSTNAVFWIYPCRNWYTEAERSSGWLSWPSLGTLKTSSVTTRAVTLTTFPVLCSRILCEFHRKWPHRKRKLQRQRTFRVPEFPGKLGADCWLTQSLLVCHRMRGLTATCPGIQGPAVRPRLWGHGNDLRFIDSHPMNPWMWNELTCDKTWLACDGAHDNVLVHDKSTLKIREMC